MITTNFRFRGEEPLPGIIVNNNDKDVIELIKAFKLKWDIRKKLDTHMPIVMHNGISLSFVHITYISKEGDSGYMYFYYKHLLGSDLRPICDTFIFNVAEYLVNINDQIAKIAKKVRYPLTITMELGKDFIGFKAYKDHPAVEYLRDN